VTSVVVPAHDEAAVIGRCLRALLAGADPGELDVVVVANGCTDDTAERARSCGYPVTVVELAEGGKVGALNAGDRVARGFPRIYLDADVVLPTTTARALAAALAQGPALAAGATPRPQGRRSSPLVRWHYAAWAALPVTNDAYLGSGVYAVSAEGHRRISPFPDVVADDEFVRRSFRARERVQVPEPFEMHLPRTAAAYVARAVRARRGNAAVGAALAGLPPDDSPRGAAPLLGLARDPRRWHQVGAFVLLTAAVRLADRLGWRRSAAWSRDATSRE